MSGFESRVRDVINQAAPTYATVAVAERGLSQLIDPSMTGTVRFMQKAGYPFPLLTPQMTADLLTSAAAGTSVVHIQGQRLLSWLLPGMTVSFELLETAVIQSVQVQADPNDVLVVLESNLQSTHAVGTQFHIRRFVIFPTSDTLAGSGAVGSPVVEVTTPFLLVPGDTLVVNNKTFTLTRADQTASGPMGFTYDIQVTDLNGLPALTTATLVEVLAKPAYRSDYLTLPHRSSKPTIGGPVAVDWVSGPMVADYHPMPESEVFLEEFDVALLPLTAPHKVQKNDTLTRIPILREQMLFWRVADGGVNWNGSYFELHAFASGFAHLWTPCRPPLDPAPLSTVARVVPLFAPFSVLLLSRVLPGSVTVVDAFTKAQIPAMDYVIDNTTGTISFTAPHGGEAVVITYQPQLEWQILARPSVDNVELSITVGQEARQAYTLGAAGTASILTVQTTTATPPDALHVAARQTVGAPGPFKVELGDWQVRGGSTAVVRYTLSTAADVDYDWASSGLLVKSAWPVLELLRARLDGDSLFARYLDNGRMLI